MPSTSKAYAVMPKHRQTARSRLSNLFVISFTPLCVRISVYIISRLWDDNKKNRQIMPVFRVIVMKLSFCVCHHVPDYILLNSMINDPLQKFFITHRTICNGKTNINDLFVSTFQANSVDLKKCQHDINTNSLISIHKSMV